MASPEQKGSKIQIHHSFNCCISCCISCISICKWDTSNNEWESLRSAQSSSNSTRGQNLSYMDFVIRKVIPDCWTSTVDLSWRQQETLQKGLSFLCRLTGYKFWFLSFSFFQAQSSNCDRMLSWQAKIVVLDNDNKSNMFLSTDLHDDCRVWVLCFEPVGSLEMAQTRRC